MNKSKRPINDKLRKQMSKAIRSATSESLSLETRKYGDELTAKEMLKKFPKKPPGKREKLLAAMQKRVGVKKAQHRKTDSKRTTPGTVPSDSSPAHIHKEGKRWIKTLTKQTLAKRAIAAHHGKKR